MDYEGEERRLHIVYFLSRLGHVEQPHLILVHHVPRNGVYLRDVKRWLGDVRGKEMPEGFSWSYKRRYRTGYVWQDLVDNDLIAPISHNEYVLKGSEVIPQNSRLYCSDEKRVSIIKEDSILKPNDENNDDPENNSETPSMASLKMIDESPALSSGSSTITEEYDSSKFEEMSSETIEEKPEDERETVKNQSSFYSFLLRKMTREIEEKNNTNSPKSSGSNTSSSSSESSFRKSNVSSSMLRNLMGFGAVITNGAVWVSEHRATDKTTSNEPDSGSKFCVGDKTGMSAIVAGIRSGKLLDFQQRLRLERNYSARRRSCDFAQETRKNSDQELAGRKSITADYKPAREPSCSQCGKTFRPDKLHAHMKSCKGIKSTAKIVKTPASTPTASSSVDLLTEIYEQSPRHKNTVPIFHFTLRNLM